MWTVSSWASFISPPPAFEMNSLTCTGLRWAIQKIGLPSCSMAEDDHLDMKMFSSTETFVHCLKKFPICCLLLAFILLLYEEFPCLFIIWAVMISDFHDYFGQNNTRVILKHCKFEKTPPQETTTILWVKLLCVLSVCLENKWHLNMSVGRWRESVSLGLGLYTSTPYIVFSMTFKITWEILNTGSIRGHAKSISHKMTWEIGVLFIPHMVSPSCSTKLIQSIYFYCIFHAELQLLKTNFCAFQEVLQNHTIKRLDVKAVWVQQLYKELFYSTVWGENNCLKRKEDAYSIQ